MNISEKTKTNFKPKGALMINGLMLYSLFSRKVSYDGGCKVTDFCRTDVNERT